jgi:hypothetical protein
VAHSWKKGIREWFFQDTIWPVGGIMTGPIFASVGAAADGRARFAWKNKTPGAARHRGFASEFGRRWLKARPKSAGAQGTS